MKIRPDKAVYKIILDSKAVPQDVLDKVWKEAEQSEISFFQKLLSSGALAESKALSIFSKATDSPVADLKKLVVDPEVIKKVPVKFAAYYKFFPVKLEKGKLTVAVSKILDINTLDEVKFSLGCDIEIAFALENDIQEMLKKHYGLAAETVDQILTDTPKSEKPAFSAPSKEVEDIEVMASIPSVAKVVNQIILDAYKKRASDIHLEPFADEIRLRYRIDGVLYDEPVPPEMKKFFTAILSRIKIVSDLNIVERRVPQDGKMRVKTQDETLDLRVSVMPTLYGESMVIRILPGKHIFNLNQLGFEPESLAIFESLLKRPNGVIFVTGPTGSGKSTTLYAALNKLNAVSRKIMTIEDPVEYELRGINQIQIAPEAGLTFSRGLRSMLRHDPDVMMVGEVRDLETADIAIRAALTGHLILSTLHTNDAVSGITRLLDIGIEPYLIASSVTAFIAQRLVRKLCVHCKEKDTSKNAYEIRELVGTDLELAPNEPVSFYKGKGCDECNGSGFMGRISLHEIFVIDSEIQSMILKKMPSDSIKTKALEKGMLTLRQDGWKKVLKGITTSEEILQATSTDAHNEILKKTEALFSYLNERSEMPEEVVEEPPQSASPPVSRPVETKKKEEESPQSNFTDQRKYNRIRINIKISFRVIESDSHPFDKATEFSAATEDLSAGGMFFIYEEIWGYKSREGVAAGDILEFKIFLPDQDQPLECMGKILRVRRTVRLVNNREQWGYQVGALFLAINSTDRIRIEKFCKNQEQK